MSGSLGFKQNVLIDTLNANGFITPADLKKLYPVHSLGMNAIKSLEILGYCIWNKDRLRWDKIDNP